LPPGIQLADAFGLSLVTTNRILRDLKAEQLIDYEKGKVTIRDRRKLCEVAKFDEAELELSTWSTGDKMMLDRSHAIQVRDVRCR
jgi:DNA-binding GntR family transcriptional regulator